MIIEVYGFRVILKERIYLMGEFKCLLFWILNGFKSGSCGGGVKAQGDSSQVASLQASSTVEAVSTADAVSTTVEVFSTFV
ncbi:hypothetical protein ACMX1E_01855 [Bartonella bacilliformis]|uniref:hypothetical protein n=1 Tax=Bartonella bacilliformis TaxID=774 RepID=UPI0004A0D6EE|nr:hypothetical protein [Bartonella bacilliformis]KEG18156.1 hypothetical protein H709_00196 [Bartonella bacilliformis CUSCO5]